MDEMQVVCKLWRSNYKIGFTFQLVRHDRSFDVDLRWVRHIDSVSVLEQRHRHAITWVDDQVVIFLVNVLGYILYIRPVIIPVIKFVFCGQLAQNLPAFYITCYIYIGYARHFNALCIVMGLWKKTHLPWTYFVSKFWNSQQIPWNFNFGFGNLDGFSHESHDKKCAAESSRRSEEKKNWV